MAQDTRHFLHAVTSSDDDTDVIVWKAYYLDDRAHVQAWDGRTSLPTTIDLVIQKALRFAEASGPGQYCVRHVELKQSPVKDVGPVTYYILDLVPTGTAIDIPPPFAPGNVRVFVDLQARVIEPETHEFESQEEFEVFEDKFFGRDSDTNEA